MCTIRLHGWGRRAPTPNIRRIHRIERARRIGAGKRARTGARGGGRSPNVGRRGVDRAVTVPARGHAPETGTIGTHHANLLLSLRLRLRVPVRLGERHTPTWVPRGLCGRKLAERVRGLDGLRGCRG